MMCMEMAVRKESNGHISFFFLHLRLSCAPGGLFFFFLSYFPCVQSFCIAGFGSGICQRQRMVDGYLAMQVKEAEAEKRAATQMRRPTTHPFSSLVVRRVYSLLRIFLSSSHGHRAGSVRGYRDRVGSDRATDRSIDIYRSDLAWTTVHVRYLHISIIRFRLLSLPFLLSCNPCTATARHNPGTAERPLTSYSHHSNPPTFQLGSFESCPASHLTAAAPTV